jgi:hypothetical protein
MSLKSFFSQKMPTRSDVRMTDIAPVLFVGDCHLMKFAALHKCDP